MSDNFISIFDSMPPLNVLCECKFKHRDHTNTARFVNDTKTNTYWFTRVADKDCKFTGTKEGTLLHVPAVLAWRALETKEEGDNWLRQMSKYSINELSTDLTSIKLFILK